MKHTLVLLPLLFATNVHASWFQEYCSNGEGTVKIAQGHNENVLTLTNRIWEDGRQIDTPVQLNEWSVTPLHTQSLEIENGSDCRPGDTHGIGWWRNLEFRTVQIRNPDGSLFDANIIGVTADRQAVEADLICEENGNSDHLCRP